MRTVYAEDLTRVPPHFACWQAFDPAVKTDLVSTAVETNDGVIIFDPIPLAPQAMSELAALGKVVAIVLTNANHRRGVVEFAQKFTAEIFAPAEIAPERSSFSRLAEAMKVHGLEMLSIPGGAPGEFAAYDSRAGGSFIIGDALINLESYGFVLLPPKYCSDQKLMARSLRRLLDFPFSRLFFAHGIPIVARARERLATLLDPTV